MLNDQVFGRGDHRNTASEYLIDGRRIRAAPKAPQRKRPCRSWAPSVDPSRSWFRCAQPILRGSITREVSGGDIIACFASKRGGAQDGLSAAKRRPTPTRALSSAYVARAAKVTARQYTLLKVIPPCGARPISWRPRAAEPACPRSAAAFPVGLRRACGSSLPAPASHARLARCAAARP
jgi:hypothetical protein